MNKSRLWCAGKPSLQPTRIFATEPIRAGILASERIVVRMAVVVETRLGILVLPRKPPWAEELIRFPLMLGRGGKRTKYAGNANGALGGAMLLWIPAVAGEVCSVKAFWPLDRFALWHYCNSLTPAGRIGVETVP